MTKYVKTQEKTSKLKVKTRKVGAIIPGCRKSVQKKPESYALEMNTETQ